MKNLFRATLLAICIWQSAFAQTFEGTLNWSISMEFSDPEMKKKMENASKELNSPENQAKIKEIQKQLNDPQMKAMLDQNPQMKDMLEKQLAAMSGGGTNANSMMPKSIEFKLKNGSSLVKTSGGMFESEVLYLKEKDKTFVLDRKNKTYTPQESNTQTSSQAQYNVTKTEEFITILNYKSRKYIVDVTDRGQKLKYLVWASTDIKDIDSKQLSKMRIGRAGSSDFMTKIEGVPLKIQASTAEGNMTIQVVGIKKEALPSELFAIPTGFSERK
ncbi:MAG: DUF4412 domain-containing protein [Cytophagales bacterium]|nr:DUF4412 domain-containing protein [Cytophagales bacterium]